MAAPHDPEPLGLYAQLACLWEATARKPGNVHRFADFEDLTYVDLLGSAAAIAPTFNNVALGVTRELDFPPVGLVVVWGVEATRKLARSNTNLGILLLLAPLASATQTNGLRLGVQKVLNGLTVEDADKVYHSIRLAQPGGLGQVDQQDISTTPTRTLREVMALAADRDLVARQYANGFQEVFEVGVPALQHGLEEYGNLEDAIIGCHLQLLSQYPDSLIARKCGKEVAEEASSRTARVLNAGWPNTKEGHGAIAELDAWLRSDGHRRNPGTTADLVTASLFLALREGIITLPLEVPWSANRK
jgi:triphosphoribosyl-dephospho-CoA synthase